MYMMHCQGVSGAIKTRKARGEGRHVGMVGGRGLGEALRKQCLNRDLVDLRRWDFSGREHNIKTLR